MRSSLKKIEENSEEGNQQQYQQNQSMDQSRRTQDPLTIKDSNLLQQTLRLKEALESNYLKQSTRVSPSRHHFYSEPQQNIQNLGIFKNQLSAAHMNPALSKIYKRKSRESQNLFSRPRNSNQLQMEYCPRVSVNLQEKPQYTGSRNNPAVYTQRFSLPAKKKPNALQDHSQYQKLKSPFKRTPQCKSSRSESIQRCIRCPKCQTKVTKIVLNSDKKQARSPRILLERSPVKMKEKFLKDNKYGYQLSKNQLANLEQYVQEQISKCREYMHSAIQVIKNHMLLYKMIQASKQQRIFTLEARQINYIEYIDKIQAQNEKLKKMVVEGIHKKDIKILGEEFDSVYEGRMENFYERTQFTESVLLKGQRRKNTGKNDDTRGSAYQNVSDYRTKTKESRIRESNASQELELLQKLLESHLIYNY